MIISSSEVVLIGLQRHTIYEDCPLLDIDDCLVGSDDSENEEYIITCYCANKEDDGNRVMCAACHTWQHFRCYYHSSERVPEFHVCTTCVPRTIKIKNTVERKSVTKAAKVELGIRKRLIQVQNYHCHRETRWLMVLSLTRSSLLVT